LTAVLHRGQLGREYVVARVAAVVATTACLIVGPGLPELASLVARHVGPGNSLGPHPEGAPANG